MFLSIYVAINRYSFPLYHAAFPLFGTNMRFLFPPFLVWCHKKFTQTSKKGPWYFIFTFEVFEPVRRVCLCLQDISYFDDHNNGVGALTTRLSTDASQVQGVSTQ